MKENDINILAFNLHEAIEKDPRVIALKIAEKQMEANEEVMRLSYAYDLSQTEYNDILKTHSENSKEAGIAQKKLYDCKKTLDEMPLVQNYMEAYKEVRKLYQKIQTAIFLPFNTHECGGKE